MSVAKTKSPSQEPTPASAEVLLAHPRPERDPLVAAKEIIERYPVIMARLAE